jgi:hypothetical protein
MAFSFIISSNIFAAVDNWEPLLDVAFEQNDIEMAVLVLVNDNNVPVSDIITKARNIGFGYTRIFDALVDTKLSCEQIIIEALKNNVPPKAVFDSEKVRDDYSYTPETILRLVVKELRFMSLGEESLGEKDQNLSTRNANLTVIHHVCKSMMDYKDY